MGISLVVEKLGATDLRTVRKTLSNLLVRIGAPAVPVILTMVSDERWFIIRNLVAVLGEIGSPEAVPGLQQCLRHRDSRVSKETIRSLAKIGGPGAETAIISVLSRNDPFLLPQAITSLGGMRSRKALVELMRILLQDDLFLNTLPLKIEAAAAIAMIGDTVVVPQLVTLLQSRHLMARNRWLHLKIALADCLGRLGDPRALPILRNLAPKPGELGLACGSAIDSIERSGGDSNEKA